MPRTGSEEEAQEGEEEAQEGGEEKRPPASADSLERVKGGEPKTQSPAKDPPVKEGRPCFHRQGVKRGELTVKSPAKGEGLPLAMSTPPNTADSSCMPVDEGGADGVEGSCGKGR